MILARTGRTAGMVGDDGLVYLTGVAAEDRDALTVTWAGEKECHLTLPDPAALAEGPQPLPCR